MDFQTLYSKSDVADGCSKGFLMAPYLRKEEAYIYILYTPRTLGLAIAVFDREREQGRFRGSTGGVGGRSKGALREQSLFRGNSEGVAGEHQGSRGSIEGA